MFTTATLEGEFMQKKEYLTSLKLGWRSSTINDIKMVELQIPLHYLEILKLHFRISK